MICLLEIPIVRDICVQVSERTLNAHSQDRRRHSATYTTLASRTPTISNLPSVKPPENKNQNKKITSARLTVKPPKSTKGRLHVRSPSAVRCISAKMTAQQKHAFRSCSLQDVRCSIQGSRFNVLQFEMYISQTCPPTSAPRLLSRSSLRW